MLYFNVKAMDYSTISREELEKLPVFDRPATYEISRNLGMGCNGNAPGYPTYFLQSVYTQHGNTPRKGPTVVMFDPWNQVYRVIETATSLTVETEARLRKLWVPVPMDAERFTLWERSVYLYYGAGYINLDLPTEKLHIISNSIIYWPLQTWQLISMGYRPADDKDARYSDEYKTLERERAAQQLAEMTAHYAPMHFPDNAAAVKRIREFYPDAQPNLALLDEVEAHVDRRVDYPNEWWQVYASEDAARAAYDSTTPYDHRKYNAFGITEF